MEKREYRAAVISAMGLLEATLPKRREKPDWNRGSQPMSVRQLIEVASAQGLIRNVNSERIATNVAVSRETARSIVEGVRGIVGS